jgi:hypothetical protein
MVVVPEAIAVTMPEVASTVPIRGFVLDHTPPTVVELNVDVPPGHMLVVPVMALGIPLTVTIAVVLHVVGKVYVIKLVPAASPATTPVDEPTEATDKALLAHVPPASALLKDDAAPGQTSNAPVIAAGSGLTVTVSVAMQPVLIV